MNLHFDNDTRLLAGALSALIQVGQDLWVGGDEGTTLAVLRRGGDGAWRVVRTLDLSTILALPMPKEVKPGKGIPEIDIEGLDWHDDFLWIVGSHSLKRGNPKRKDADTGKWLDELDEVKADGNRCLLARVPLALDAEGRSALDKTRRPAQLASDAFRSEILKELAGDRHFRRFLPAQGKEAEKFNLPGKDNGLDIEGLAVANGGRVFVGLRGPVLRGWAAIVEFKVGVESDPGKLDTLVLKAVTDDRDKYRKTFLELDGLSVRDLAWDGEDLLILAGPALALDWPPAIFRWEKAAARAKGGHRFVWQQDGALKKIGLGGLLPFHTGMDHAETVARLSAPTFPGGGFLIGHDSPTKQRKLSDTELLVDIFQPSAAFGEEVWARQFDLANLADELWLLAWETAVPADIQDGCAEELREFIGHAVRRVLAEDRTSPDDLTKFAASLRYLVLALRQQAVLLGHPDWIGKDTLAAVQNFARSGAVKFELRPFWPPFWK